MEIHRIPQALIGDRQMPGDIEAIAALAVLFVLNALLVLALVIT